MRMLVAPEHAQTPLEFRTQRPVACFEGGAAPASWEAALEPEERAHLAQFSYMGWARAPPSPAPALRPLRL